MDSVRTIRGRRIDGTGGEWDVIRVSRSLGLDALGVLGHRSGAVLEDPSSAALYFFVAEVTPGEWDVAGTRVLGHGDPIVIPPLRRTRGPGPHWRVCPGDGGWPTEGSVLRAALEGATGPSARGVL
ncbi:hypothetical protein [Streptomyces arboris]|uniref:hypothetical protein n=1 Tax=Streptomyces arboris TaxID=2600619 RepID=UPI00363914D5